MNEGSYPDILVDEVIELMQGGANPRDVADWLRLDKGYTRLHWKTVARWYKKYPLGKSPELFPPVVVDKIQKVVQDVVQDLGQEERKKPCAEHVFFKDSVKEVFSVKTVASSRTDKVIETQTCRLCGFKKPRRTFFAIT